MRQKLGRLGIAALIHGITMLLLFHPTHDGRTLPAVHRPHELVYMSPATLAVPHQLRTPGRALLTPTRPRQLPRSRQPALPPLVDSNAAPEQAVNAPESATNSTISPDAATIMAQARRDLQRIDKELLNGARSVPARSPDSLSARLARGIEGAFVGATSEVSDHYTSPDGIMYSRITRGNRSTCYTSGTPSYATATRSGGNWVRVNCPAPDSGWVR